MAKREGKPENLKPPRSKDEARERGSKGGVKSGQARRRKRDMKQAADLILSMRVQNPAVLEILEGLDVPEEERSYSMAVVVSMIREAILNGNVRSAEFLRDLVGDGALARERKEKLRLERERLEMDKAQKQDNGEGMPVIINIRPNDESGDPEDGSRE